MYHTAFTMKDSTPVPQDITETVLAIADYLQKRGINRFELQMKGGHRVTVEVKPTFGSMF